MSTIHVTFKGANGCSYVVMSSVAKMPVTCYGYYRRIALMCVEGDMPKIIRESNTTRIMRTWEKLSKGETKRCAFEVALKEATEYALAVSL